MSIKLEDVKRFAMALLVVLVIMSFLYTTGIESYVMAGIGGWVLGGWSCKLADSILDAIDK